LATDIGREPVTLSEHGDRVTGLAAVGKTLVSVSWDLTLRVWNLDQAFNDKAPR